MAQWKLYMKNADFYEIGRKHHIDPVIARIIRNRDIVEDVDIEKYLMGGLEYLYAPNLLFGMEKGVAFIRDSLAKQEHIRIIGDYDIDGVCATYILWKALIRAGGKVDTMIPHRMMDGYGLNQHMIEQAAEEGVDTIITCDNGIAAAEQVALAKQLGMKMIITDHHEVPFQEKEGVRTYLYPAADAIIDPKQTCCAYPFKEICGAVVAMKFAQALLGEEMEAELFDEFLELAAFATIGDVMPLVDENRILVREGLKRMQHSKNTGLRALTAVTDLMSKRLKPYHIGFILGPCMNAMGRLDTAAKSLALLQEKEYSRALGMAAALRDMNEDRKSLTAAGVEEAVRQIEEKSIDKDRVLVIYLPECHESLAGIIAGRIREKYGKPAFVLTDGEESVKGSGRSIEAYHMYEEINKCKDLFIKYGGHRLAAGLSLTRENVPAFRQRINALCTLTEEDFIETIHVDVAMPLGYVTKEFVRSLSVLEPFGIGNPKPVFAVKDVCFLSGRILGKNQNVGKYMVEDENGARFEMIYYGDLAGFHQYITAKYGQEMCDALYQSMVKDAGLKMSVIYYPDVNEYKGQEKLQFVMQQYC